MGKGLGMAMEDGPEVKEDGRWKKEVMEDGNHGRWVRAWGQRTPKCGLVGQK